MKALLSFEILLVLVLFPFLFFAASQNGDVRKDFIELNKVELTEDVLASWQHAGKLDVCRVNDGNWTCNLDLLKADLAELSASGPYKFCFRVEDLRFSGQCGELVAACSFRTLVMYNNFKRIFVCVIE